MTIKKRLKDLELKYEPPASFFVHISGLSPEKDAEYEKWKKEHPDAKVIHVKPESER